MQTRPGFLAGAPDHAPEAAPRVAQRRHEQPRPAVAVAARHARGRTLAIVDLHLLTGQEAQAVELLGLMLAQVAHEALDRVVGASEAVLVDQVLIDGCGVAPQPQLRLDESPVRLARRHRHPRRCRWPGWRSLRYRVGGHPGGICRSSHPLLVAADRLAIDPGHALDLALAGPGLQQRPDRRLQMQLQDVHSYPLCREGPKVTSCSAPASRKNRQISAS